MESILRFCRNRATFGVVPYLDQASTEALSELVGAGGNAESISFNSY
jgi:hypothetical protein